VRWSYITDSVPFPHTPYADSDQAFLANADLREHFQTVSGTGSDFNVSDSFWPSYLPYGLV
jgi:hypothetical protein